MEQQAMNLPKEIYYVAGVLVIANIGTIVTIIIAAFRVVWWASKADSRITENKAMSVRAHKRIDRLEARIDS